MEELCLQHWRHSSTNKVVGFFQSFIPFSVPCSLISNFKLSSLGALRTNKDEKWVFLCCLMWCLPSHPSMHSLLQSCWGLLVWMVCQYSASPRGHAGLGLPLPSLSSWGVHGVWVAQLLCAGMLTPPWATWSSHSLFFYPGSHAQSSQLERLTISHISDLLKMWCNLFIA